MGLGDACCAWCKTLMRIPPLPPHLAGSSSSSQSLVCAARSLSSSPSECQEGWVLPRNTSLAFEEQSVRLGVIAWPVVSRCIQHQPSPSTPFTLPRGDRLPPLSCRHIMYATAAGIGCFLAFIGEGLGPSTAAEGALRVEGAGFGAQSQSIAACLPAFLAGLSTASGLQGPHAAQRPGRAHRASPAPLLPAPPQACSRRRAWQWSPTTRPPWVSRDQPHQAIGSARQCDAP